MTSSVYGPLCTDRQPLAPGYTILLATLSLATGKGLGALPRRALTGRPITALFAGDARIAADVRRAMKGEAFTATVTAWGRAFECALAPLPRQMGERGVLGIAFDVTALEQTQEALRSSNERLHHLAARLQAGQEEERRRVARTVHDVVGQALTAVQFELQRLESDAGKAGSEEASVRSGAERAMELVEEAVRATQAVATELRPGLLDRFGLAAALGQQAATFEARTDIQCTVTCSPAARNAADALPAGARLALYRIAQEALTNVARHAGASAVQICLIEQAGRLVLEATDDGRGISPEALDAVTSLGLTGMRERTLAWGGTLEIEPRPGGGTCLRAELPL